jgi:hypothetical protein
MAKPESRSITRWIHIADMQVGNVPGNHGQLRPAGRGTSIARTLPVLEDTPAPWQAAVTPVW